MKRTRSRCNRGDGVHGSARPGASRERAGGHAFGARDRAAISLAGWTAFWMTMAFVAVAVAAMFAFPASLISPFIATEVQANAAIVALALSFLRIAAIFQVFDGGQAASPTCCAASTTRAGRWSWR